MQYIRKIAEGIFAKITKNVSLNDLLIILAGILSPGAVLAFSRAPFGLACGIAYILSDYFSFSVLFPMLGYVLFDYNAFSVIYIVTLATFAMLPRGMRESRYAGVGLYCIFSGVFLVFYQPDIFNFVLLALECVLIYISVNFYRDFLRYFSGQTIRRTVTKAELKSLSAVVLVILIPLSKIYMPLDMTPAGIISALVILFCALELDIGTCVLCGSLLGTVMGLSNPQMLYCIGSYTVSSVGASLGKRYGKAGTLAGFVITNALITYFSNGSSEVLINIYEAAVASMILLLLSYPVLENVKENVSLLLQGGKEKEIKRMEMFKKETEGKLLKMSGAFSNLAEVLGRFDKRRSKNREEDEIVIIESIRDRVCTSCRNFEYCWKIEGERTYKTVSKLIDAVEKRGWVENYDLSSGFRNSCYFSGKIVLETNKVYELYRVNRIWENKIAESRQLISRQLQDVSEAVKHFAGEFKNDCTYEISMEDMAVSMLDVLGVKVTGVNIVKDKSGRLKAKVNIRECVKNSLCERKIEPVLSKVCGKKMKCVNKGCFGGNCTVELVEKENYKIDKAVARVRPLKENKYGDSYAIIKPDSERVIVALSDGMGTGERAANESLEAVNLLERLLVAGIEKETAIKLINSVLILKSYEESFATLDMLIFDLYSGMGEFVKTGGAASYIKRGEQIIKIKSDSLPAGIIGGVDPGSYRIPLNDGDVVVLISDGISDVSSNDEWLKSLLKDPLDDVREITEEIINRAMAKVGEPVDDMTALVVKIMYNN